MTPEKVVEGCTEADEDEDEELEKDREEKDEIADGSEHDNYLCKETFQQNCNLNASVAGLTILGKTQRKTAQTLSLGLPESGRAIKLRLL